MLWSGEHNHVSYIYPIYLWPEKNLWLNPRTFDWAMASISDCKRLPEALSSHYHPISIPLEKPTITVTNYLIIPRGYILRSSE